MFPQGTFHMGPSDEDPAYALVPVTVLYLLVAFWMDATEITNNEYRQFVIAVRDSVRPVNWACKSRILME